MSVAGIASTLLSHLSLPSSQTSQQQKIQTEFQQLAQDLQAGNLTQAQTDFSALQQSAPAASSTSNASLAQEFSAVGSDLQSGNLSAAQQDFANLEQTVQQSSQGGQVHHHHHHHGGGGAPTSSATQQNSLTQLLNTLGQDLQSGSLTQAQQAYNQLAQSLQVFGLGSSLSVSGTALPSSGLSVSV